MTTSYDPERSFGFLLHDAARLLRREFERRARAHGLTRAQWAAIAHLRRREGCNQSTLADLLEVEPITLARLLDRMEAAGWVERRPDPVDRRARLVYLADKARPLVDKLVAFAAETRQEALAGLPPEQQDWFIAALQQVRANLSRRDSAARERRARRTSGGRKPNGRHDIPAEAGQERAYHG